MTKRVYTEDSELSKKVEQVEDLMNKLNLTLTVFDDRFVVYDTTDGHHAEAVLVNTETNEFSTSFPRIFESERLGIPGDF